MLLAVLPPPAGLLSSSSTLGHLSWSALRTTGRGRGSSSEDGSPEEGEGEDEEGKREEEEREEEGGEGERGGCGNETLTRGAAAFNCVLYGLPHVCLVPPVNS